MRLLSVDEIIILHQKLIVQTGGSHGVRDMGLIESAVNRASAIFCGVDLLKTTEAKIAATTFGLVNNHELFALGLGIADGSIDDLIL